MDDVGSKPPQKASSGLTELVGRALTDNEFRELLYSDRRSAVEGYQLSPADHEALQSIPRTTMEEQARQLDAGSATAVIIKISVKF